MNKQNIFDLIVQCIREVVPGLEDYSFVHEDTLQSLGANSVDRAEIMISVLEKLGMDIPRIELLKASNLGELANLLHGRL